MQYNKYERYTPLDFLKDEDFLRWNLFQYEEDKAYWINMIGEFPAMEPLVLEAVELYNTQVRLNDYTLAPEYIEQYHQAFYDRIERRKKRNSIYKWLSATAAIFLIAFTIYRIYNESPGTESSELLHYVQTRTLSPDSLSKDIQLLVSPDELITLTEKEAQISYQSDSVAIKGKAATGLNTVAYSQLMVPKGKKTVLRLPDGTVMHVNSGTKVVYPNRFTGNIREIYVSGEVYLDVVPNPTLPFIVRTDKLAVRVLGTKFNVRSYRDDAEEQVVLASGAVQITAGNNGEKINLQPSQMYSYAGSRPEVTAVDVEKYISWTQGILYVEDERLDLLMQKLSRYYGQEITFDKSVMNQRCTGKIDLKNDLGEVLRGLTFSFPIKVKNENGGYRVSAE